MCLGILQLKPGGRTVASYHRITISFTDLAFLSALVLNHQGLSQGVFAARPPVVQLPLRACTFMMVSILAVQGYTGYSTTWGNNHRAGDNNSLLLSSQQLSCCCRGLQILPFSLLLGTGQEGSLLWRGPRPLR